jgi:hypothetical protein
MTLFDKYDCLGVCLRSTKAPNYVNLEYLMQYRLYFKYIVNFQDV